MNAVEVFKQEGAERTAQRKQQELEQFTQAMAPFLEMRANCERELERYHEVRPKAQAKLEEIAGIPWQALGFWNPPGFIAHHLRDLQMCVGNGAKALTDSIKWIDELRPDDFLNGVEGPLPRRIREFAGCKPTDSLQYSMRALDEELEKYAGRIRAGQDPRDVKIVGEVPPAAPEPGAKPKVKREFNVLAKKGD